MSNSDLMTLLGHSWTGYCSAAAMNGDYGGGSSLGAVVIGISYDRNVGMNVHLNKAVGGPIRVNWIIVDTTNMEG